MGRSTVVIPGVIVMVALIVGLDIAFLRDNVTLRLVVNIAIVVIFAVLYFTLVRGS